MTISSLNEPADPRTEPQAPLTALDATDGAGWRKVLSWALWDWGTQPFATVITTFVFAVYITSASFGDENHTSKAMSLTTGLSGVLVALLAPVLGQNSDRSGRKVTNLRWQTWGLALISMALYFVKPEPAYLWVGLILLGVGSIIGEIGSVNYNALLDDIATGKNVGRISGFGWGMGYLGGIVVLLLLYFGFIAPEVGLFGVSDAGATNIRVSMIICGLWTLLFTIPTFVALKDRPRAAKAPRVGILESYRLLGASIMRLWRESRHTLYFLMASALYRDGLAGVFAFGGVLAAGTFGFSAGEVIIFGAAANIVAGVFTILFGLLDDKLGPKAVIVLSLVCLIISGLAVFFLHDGGKTVFWIAGMVMCMFVGPAQSASRSFLARVIPEGRAGEVFGLYATTGRVVSFLAPTFFGLSILIGEQVFPGANVQYWGILGVVVVLVAGLCVLLPVKDHRHHKI